MRAGTVKVIALVLVAFMALPAFIGPQVTAREYTTLLMKTFRSGDASVVMDFPVGGKQKAGIDIDIDSIVFNATVDALPAPHTEGGLDYPREPLIDIGADGVVDWGFKGPGYGRWGLQDVFNDNSSEINLQFEGENQTREIRFKMPKGADIIGGSFTTGGWPVPYWGPEFVMSNTSTKSKGEESPVMLVFNGLMFEAWVSKDPTLKDGSDKDIVYRTFDGKNWSKTMEITPTGDWFQDDSPNLVIYQGRLYCIWSAAETEDFFSNDDLLMRWTEDGYTWSSVKKLSPSHRNGMNDWPATAVFQEKLYVVWKTTDPNIADVTGDNDMDLVYRWWDGANFGPIDELTKNDDGTMDWSYDVDVYNNRLFVVWETDTSGLFTTQVDIVVKSFDGVSWSARKMLSPDGDSVKDEIAVSYVWYNPVKKMEEYWVIWGRGDGNPDGTGDIDIVVRSFDGMKWTGMQEISQPNIVAQNMGHSLFSYEGRLYAIWIDGKEAVTVDSSPTLIVFKIYGNIVIRSFDGYEWSNIKELTPEGTTNKASDPQLCVYNGKLYATWSFPNDASTSSKDWDIILRNIDFRDVTLEMDIGRDGTVDWSGELLSSQQTIPLNRTQIESAMTGGSITDEFGNNITEVAIRIKSRYPAKILAHDLKIEYDYRRTFDFKDRLNGRLEEERLKSNSSRQVPEGTVGYEFEAKTSSEGKIIFEDLKIDYIMNHRPFLVKDIPTVYMEEDTDLLDALDMEEYLSDDWDDGRLSFRVQSMEDPNYVGVVLNGSMVGFTTPTENWNGWSNVTLLAADSFGLVYVPILIRVRVLPVNDIPVLDLIPDQTLRAGEKFKYKCTAFDVDGDKLSFSSNSTLFKINPETGEIAFLANKRGVFRFNVTVSDGFGGMDSKGATYIVKGETTTSGTGTCYSLLAFVILGLAIFLVAYKFRHEFTWHPVGAEKLKVGEEGDGKTPRQGRKARSIEPQVIPGTEKGAALPDDSVLELPTIDMEEVDAEEEEASAEEAKDGPAPSAAVKAQSKMQSPKASKRNAVVPGTDEPMEKYDTNKDGFLDDAEWNRAIEQIRQRKAERLAQLREKAKGLAKKEVTPASSDSTEEGEGSSDGA